MRNTLVAAWLLASLTFLQACNGFFGCEPSEPFEAIVVDNFMQSFHADSKWAKLTDTVRITASSARRIDFRLSAIPKRISAKENRLQLSVFSPAYACSPLYLPFTLQKFNGSRITANIAFGNDYPAGADLSPLFELNHWSADGKTIHFKQVLDSLGLDPILSERNALTSYTFKGQTTPGQLMRFQWELFLDSDTLRNQSAWWQF